MPLEELHPLLKMWVFVIMSNKKKIIYNNNI